MHVFVVVVLVARHICTNSSIYDVRFYSLFVFFFCVCLALVSFGFSSLFLTANF